MTAEEMAAQREVELRVEKIRWPDGPVCPYCGEREKVVGEFSGGRGRLRYECPACRIHQGYIRRPGSREKPPEGAPSRRQIVPRFPRGSLEE